MSDKLNTAVQQLGTALASSNLKPDHPAFAAMRDIQHLERERAADQKTADDRQEGQMILTMMMGIVAGFIIASFVIGQLLMNGSIEEQWFVNLVDAATKLMVIVAIIGAIALIWFIGYKTGEARNAIKKKREAEHNLSTD